VLKHDMVCSCLLSVISVSPCGVFIIKCSFSASLRVPLSFPGYAPGMWVAGWLVGPGLHGFDHCVCTTYYWDGWWCMAGDTVQWPVSIGEPPRVVSLATDAVRRSLLMACQPQLHRLQEIPLHCHRSHSCYWSQTTLWPPLWVQR